MSTVMRRERRVGGLRFGDGEDMREKGSSGRYSGHTASDRRWVYV